MFRQKGLTADELRAKFLEIAEGENWFTEFYQQRKLARDTGDDTLYEQSKDQAKRIRLLFDGPPYEFLREGDAPPTLLLAGRKRQRRTTRNPASSKYAAMRGDTVNYSNLPNKLQFVDSVDKDTQRRYWLVGVDLQSVVVEPAEVYSMLKTRAQTSTDDTLSFRFALPIHTKRASPHIGLPQVEEEFALYFVQPRSKVVTPVARLRFESVPIVPGRSTGTITARLIAPA